MILLTEIAEKLQDVLNGVDSEITTMGITRPATFNYRFRVATQGFHLDHITDDSLGSNFIPVFISCIGGQYDAIPNMKRTTSNIQVCIYFPVRFKDSFYLINDYLANCFVGQYLEYGTHTGKCLSNISVAQYGEIQDLDLREFKSWVENLYQEKVDVMQPYMSMTFSLYLTSSGDPTSLFFFGNIVKYNLAINYLDSNNTQQTINEDLVWSQSGTGVNNSPIAQQLIDTDSYAKNVINITNYNKSMLVYVKNNEFWGVLLDLYNNQQMNKILSTTLTKTYNFSTPKVYTYSQVLLSLNENVSLGDLVSFTITYGD